VQKNVNYKPWSRICGSRGASLQRLRIFNFGEINVEAEIRVFSLSWSHFELIGWYNCRRFFRNGVRGGKSEERFRPPQASRSSRWPCRIRCIRGLSLGSRQSPRQSARKKERCVTKPHGCRMWLQIEAQRMRRKGIELQRKATSFL
jgi:hypothetical protein